MNNILQVLKTIRNPQQMAMELLQNNPQVGAMLQGKNPKQVALELMKQKGIDANEIQQVINGLKR